MEGSGLERSEHSFRFVSKIILHLFVSNNKLYILQIFSLHNKFTVLYDHIMLSYQLSWIYSIDVSNTVISFGWQIIGKYRSSVIYF